MTFRMTSSNETSEVLEAEHLVDSVVGTGKVERLSQTRRMRRHNLNPGERDFVEVILDSGDIYSDELVWPR